MRKLEKSGELIVLSGADPLNLVGILTPDARVTAIARNRILFRDGVAIAAWEGGEVRVSSLDDETLRGLLSRRASVKQLKPYFRTATERERQMLERKRGTVEMAQAVILGRPDFTDYGLFMRIVIVLLVCGMFAGASRWPSRRTRISTLSAMPRSGRMSSTIRSATRGRSRTR